MGDIDLAPLADRVAHRFARPELLREALTHPSAAGGGQGGRQERDYNRLEFLGDRVLGMVIADYLLHRHPEAEAGELARRFNALVRRETLAKVARAIDLGDFLLLAKGERASGGADKPAILADACEALIGALYLDGGFKAAQRFILDHWRELAERAAGAPKDAKTALQELAHKLSEPEPEYRVVAEEGPPHDPVFTVEVRLAGREPCRGISKSKRGAEQAAASAMLKAIR